MICGTPRLVPEGQRESKGMESLKGTCRHADEVDGHEEKVDAAAEAGDAEGPDLGDEDAADGAARRGKVEAAGTYRRGKDLRVQ